MTHYDSSLLIFMLASLGYLDVTGELCGAFFFLRGKIKDVAAEAEGTPVVFFSSFVL